MGLLRQLKRDWHDAWHKHPRLVFSIVAAFVIVASISIVGGVWFLTGLRNGMPGVDALRRIGEMDQATAVFDNSNQLAFTIFKEQRIEVPLSEVSPNLTKAVTAVEDQRFYDHNGFDLVRMASAFVANVRHHRKAQGGSTITQQLARQSFLTPNKSYHRKVQELILAARIERLYSKKEILELYLNKVYFGDGLYGVEAASRGYFGKHASEVSVPEAALLAGLVKSPSTYAPTVSMDRALARRNIVLQTMLDSGAIDRATCQSARATTIALRDTLRAEEPHGQYFKEQVRIDLVNRFGWQRVYQGGLRVFSTIDMPMQLAAESIVFEHIKAIEARRGAWQSKRASAQNAVRKNSKGQAAPSRGRSDALQAALIALDPASGQVRAMVGGRNFDASHFNRAVQAHRQPGSAFKPFVYATALEAGYSPATVIKNLNDPIAIGRVAWTPDDHSSGSSMSLRNALRTSSNRAAVRLLHDVGIARTVQYAKTMGVGDVPSVPSLALGSGEVTLQAMTAAYAAFANHGLVPRPTLIRRVEDKDGNLLYDAQDTPVRAISDATAFLMSTMLADVINSGTGATARRLGFTLPAAGKTGTTNDFNDAWFIGYTPKLVAGVWVGFDQPRTILPNGFAAEIAVPVWAKFMKVATRNDKPEWLAVPPGVIAVKIDRLSGLLASEACESGEVVDPATGQIDRRSGAYTEYFARGTEPTAYCEAPQTEGVRVAGLLGDEEKPAAPRVEENAFVPAPSGSGLTERRIAPPAPRVPAERAILPAPARAPAEYAIAPPAPTGTSGKVQETENPATNTTTTKKRRFWQKIFGTAIEEKPYDPEPPPPPPKKKSGG
jgi:penicillin-binding protein 1A